MRRGRGERRICRGKFLLETERMAAGPRRLNRSVRLRVRGSRSRGQLSLPQQPCPANTRFSVAQSFSLPKQRMLARGILESLTSLWSRKSIVSPTGGWSGKFMIVGVRGNVRERSLRREASTERTPKNTPWPEIRITESADSQHGHVTMEGPASDLFVGTCKTVKTRFWPRFSLKSPKTF